MSSTKTVRFSRVPAAISLLAANAIMAQERAERETACDEAYQRGFDEATSFLNQQILEQRSDLAHLQETTLRSLADQQTTLHDEVIRLLPELAVEIARRVLAGMEPDLKTIRRITEEALVEILPGTTQVEVCLCPRDFELMSGLEQEFSHKYPGLQLRADPELAPGDCRAHSRFGQIDARVATKLQNVARSLT